MFVVPQLSQDELETCRRNSKHSVRVSNATQGFLPGALFPMSCAVRIAARKGQTLRLYVYDFSEVSDASRGPKRAAMNECPQFYVEIVERAAETSNERTPRRLCPLQQKLAVIYTSHGHVIDVRIHDVIGARSKYLFEYAGGIISQFLLALLT